MAPQSPVADLCTEVLAELDALEQRLLGSNDAEPRSFRALVLEIVQPLRTSISRLGRDAGTPSYGKNPSGIPPSIEREAISILDSCERILASLRLETAQGTLNSTNLSPSSRESAALQQLRTSNDRLQIVLDLISLSSTNLLGADSNVVTQGESASGATSKADMLVAIAQMRGLFTSKVPAPDGPPTYDEAVQGQQPLAVEEKSKARSAPSSKADSIRAPSVKPNSRGQSEASRNRPQSGELKATKLTSIQKKSKPDRDPDRDIPFRHVSGKDGGRLALTTSEAIDLYNAASGTLLWTLGGNARQLVQWYGDPVIFTRYFQFSPDGSILCVEVTRRSTNRELLILDSQDGRVITRRSLADDDGSVPYISPDNTRVALFKWRFGHERRIHIKLMPIDVASNEAYNAQEVDSWSSRNGFNMIPIPQLIQGGGITMSFAPDSKHIITSEGNLFKAGSNTGDSFSTCIRVYRCLPSGGTLVHEVRIPGSRSPTNPFFQPWKEFAMRFHYPAKDRWFVSFSDFTDNVSQTRILEPMTGETVALVSAERNPWQSWKSGVLHPHKAELTFDEASGLWTRMELTKTMLPPAQTVTITRFELPGSSWRQGSVKSIKDAWSVARSRVVVLDLWADDCCGLSRDGTRLIVQRVATQQVHVWSID